MSSLITLFDYVNIINKIYVIEKCLYVFVDLLTYHSVVLFPHCICWQYNNHAYFYQYYCNVSPSFDISQICQLNVVVDVFLFEHYWNLKKLIFEYLCFCMVLHNLRNLHMIMFFVKLHWSYCYCSQPGIGVNLPQVHRRNGLMLNGYIAGRGLGGMVWCNLKLDINIKYHSILKRILYQHRKYGRNYHPICKKSHKNHSRMLFFVFIVKSKQVLVYLESCWEKGSVSNLIENP